jgi:hypothetical protein
MRVPVSDGRPVLPPRARHAGKLWAELTEDEHHRMPGDKEAIVSQGPIAIHANEHLASSDRGVILTRRMVARALATVREGGDPPGVIRDPAARLVTTTAGNAVLAAQPQP